jgi:hypothetical protein
VEPVIHIRPAEGWGYFVRNKTRLSEELVEIASNEATNTSVYMTEENGNPYLYVYRDDKKIFQSECTTIYETERNLRVVFSTYITDLEVVGSSNDDDDDSEEAENNTFVAEADDDDDDTPPANSDLDAMSEKEFQSYINEREDVIFNAVSDLIAVLTEDSVGALEFETSDDDCVDNIVNHIVEYLAIKCGFRIRRPMTIIEDVTGFEVRTEYPYEEYEFSESELH